MDLWNEYEGRSIDGLFPLERLIRPEGRSAFFTTSSAGTSTVIRLIESHFDEDEILARWTGVSDLHQPNLLTLTRFGQAMMDETSLVYVVLEPAEADLSQILCERTLTLAETRQVATSLIPALQALHAKGFLHEHIQPANVLAVGEVVKLRSDCIREAPEGLDGELLRTRDVRDLATLLLYALTQQSTLNLSHTSPLLSTPFREIIDNGIDGSWGLAQMATALEATAAKPPKAHAVSLLATAPDADTIHEMPHYPISAATLHAVAQDRLHHRVNAPHSFPEPAEGRIRVPLRQQSGLRKRWLAGLSSTAVCLVLFAAYTLVHHHLNNRNTGATQMIAQPVLGEPPTTRTTIAPAAAASTDPVTRPLSSVSQEWRVIAFTYNRRDQAAAKALSLEERFSSLHPAVFSVTGRAPFLVTLGGPLTRESAFKLRDTLRRAGLPRDLYAQNYSPKTR